MWAHNAALVGASFEDNGRERDVVDHNRQSILVSKSKIQLSNGGYSKSWQFFHQCVGEVKSGIKIQKREASHKSTCSLDVWETDGSQQGWDPAWNIYRHTGESQLLCQLSSLCVSLPASWSTYHCWSKCDWMILTDTGHCQGLWHRDNSGHLETHWNSSLRQWGVICVMTTDSWYV